MDWKKPGRPEDDLYFRLSGFNAYTKKKQKTIPQFLQIWSLFSAQIITLSIHPTVHKDPIPSLYKELPPEENVANQSLLKTISMFILEPHWITQDDLDYLVRDLYLSKQQSGIRASRLNQSNLVKADVRINSFRRRDKDFASFSDMQNRLWYCLWLVHLPWFPTQSLRWPSFHRLFQALAQW